jgi:hypothetical protein
MAFHRCSSPVDDELKETTDVIPRVQILISVVCWPVCISLLGAPLVLPRGVEVSPGRRRAERERRVQLVPTGNGLVAQMVGPHLTRMPRWLERRVPKGRTIVVFDCSEAQARFTVAQAESAGAERRSLR